MNGHSQVHAKRVVCGPPLRAEACDPAPTADGYVPVPVSSVIRRFPNESFNAWKIVDDKKYLDKVDELISDGFQSDADQERCRARVVQIMDADGTDDTLKRRCPKILRQMDLLLTPPSKEGIDAATKGVEKARLTKSKPGSSGQHRGVYIGNARDIDAHTEGPKKESRKEKQLDVPDDQWSWKANIGWLKAAAEKFGRFKIIAKLTAEELRWIRDSPNGGSLLEKIHSAYADDTSRDEDPIEGMREDLKSLNDTDRRAKIAETINPLRQTGQLSDLWNGSEGRFTYFTEELVLLLDLKFTLDTTNREKHLMVKSGGDEQTQDGESPLPTPSIGQSGNGQ